jgi:hypothetical protein
VGKVAAGSGALPTEYELQATGPPRKWKIADLSRRIAETGAAVARGERQRAELQAVRGSAAGGYGGMALDSTSEEKRGIRVVTTGAVYFFDRTKNQIECSQRIPNLRKVAVISGLSLQTVKLDGPLAEQCKLSAGKDSFVVSRDSLLRIGFAGPATIVLRGLYQPSCQQNVDNDFFLPDEQGGVAACLVLGKAVMERSAGWAPGWRLRYAVSEPGELWVSVFPPRPFPWRQSYETMLHSFSCNRPFPSDSDLADWRRYGSILTLHSWVWKGKFGSQYGVEDDESYKAREFEPKSQGELRRVIETAHRLNMKVIVYMSPYYAADPTPQGIEDFVRRVRERIQQYGFDGVYFDGAAREVRPAYEFVVRTRQALGNDAVLHLHLTGVPSLVCPFIDCHADYILRGEHLGLSEEYARWFVSGYQLSNSIGTFCYDRLRVNKDLIDRLLRVHARLPFWVGDGTWHGAKYHLTEAEQQTMRDHYYPALEKQRASQDSSRTR